MGLLQPSVCFATACTDPSHTLDGQTSRALQHAFLLNEGHHLRQATQRFQVGHDKGLEPLGRAAHARGVGVHHVQVGTHIRS